MAAVNPLISVGGVSVPPPSSYMFKLEDVSRQDAGRTEDNVMHKKRIGQLIGIELSWRYITTADASIILQAFNPEYLDITYLDPRAGQFMTSNFYVGNRSAPMYNATMGLWENVSFNIIERSGKNRVPYSP